MALASLGAVFFLVHCCIAHKELRFVLPAVPLWCATAALGFDALRERWPRFGRVAPVVLALALTLETPPVSLTWRQLGMAHPTPEAAAFDDGGPENRLLRVAGQRPDVCGVELLNREVDASGGYSALRRAVPLFDATHPPRDPRSVNAVIGTRGSADGVELATDGAYALVRLRDVSACAPATDFDGRFH